MPEQKIFVVFDTNILIRLALGKTSASTRMWNAFTDGQFVLLISTATLSELDRVLHYGRIAVKQKLTEERIQNFLDVLRTQAMMTAGLYEVSRVEVDATDDVFLACALEGGADYLVSEDPHLRDLGEYHGVQIIGLDQFQKIIGL
jgi:hypothetical protein